MTMTHEERRRRRATIAASVEAGATIAEVCAEFGASRGHVYYCISEFGVAPPRPPRGPSKSRALPIIAALQADPQRLQSEIADEHDVSREYVRQVLARAVEAGIQFPGRNLTPRKRR